VDWISLAIEDLQSRGVEKETVGKQAADRSVSKLKLLKGIEQKQQKSGEDVIQAMSVTCYGDIGYCCGLSDNCVWRDCCRQALGIDDQTYVQVKQKVVWQMLKP